MSRFAIGDIHGNYKALLQCLVRSDFDMTKDLLIGLGDYCDGYPETAEVLYLLNSIPNKVLVLGNHDEFVIKFLKTGATPNIWTQQGGLATIKSIQGGNLKVFDKLLALCVPYYLTEDNKLFVHGGLDPNSRVEQVPTEILTWDRRLFTFAFDKVKEGRTFKIPKYYEEVYVGHTDTYMYTKDFPFMGLGVINLDQGAGYKGKLTIMNIDTKEFWQSDNGDKLYPDERGN